MPAKYRLASRWETCTVTDRFGLLLIIAAAALWGTTGTAQALGPESAEPMAVGLARLLIAGPTMLLIARPSTAMFRDRWRLIAMAGVGMAAYQPLFFTAVDRAGVAIGTVVAIGSAPLLAGAISWLVDRERPDGRWWLATIMGIGGLLAISTGGEDLGTSKSGIMMAVGAGLAFAVYLIASRRIVVKGSPVASMSLVFGTATALSLPLLAVVDLGWLTSPSGAIMTLHLGLVATALAYVLFSIGLRFTTASTAATASLFEPATAGLLGVVVLGEALAASSWVGLVLILASLGILAARRGQAAVRGVAV